MPINGKIKLIDNQNTISKKFIDHLYPKVVNVLGFAAPQIKTRIKLIVDTAIENSDTYQSLIGGTLRSDFGFTDGTPFADAVRTTVVNGIEVRVNKLRKSALSIKGGIYVGLVPASYTDFLSHPLSSYASKGGQVDWLEWLLLAGTQIVVVDHHIVYSSAKSVVNFSRSGEALMYPGGTYSVPSIYAGTKDDNWITRVIFSLQPDIEDIIQEEIIKAI